MLEEVKEYLRIDGSGEDVFLTSLISAAEEYIHNATGVETYNHHNKFYTLAVCLLVTNWYENRDPIGKADSLAFSLESILTQLKYCY
jgi:uncharacterized phage protein (predicted DNA packaging)